MSTILSFADETVCIGGVPTYAGRIDDRRRCRSTPSTACLGSQWVYRVVARTNKWAHNERQIALVRFRWNRLKMVLLSRWLRSRRQDLRALR